jgi:hypothetical protein
MWWLRHRSRHGSANSYVTSSGNINPLTSVMPDNLVTWMDHKPLADGDWQDDSEIYLPQSIHGLVNGRTGLNQIFKGAWSGQQAGSRPMTAMVLGVYRWGWRRGHSLGLGPLPHHRYSRLKYDFQACALENIGKGCTGSIIFFATVRQPWRPLLIFR